MRTKRTDFQGTKSELMCSLFSWFRAKLDPLCDSTSLAPWAHTHFSSEVSAGPPLTSHSSLSVLINGYTVFWGPAALAAFLWKKKKKKSKGSWSKSAGTELFLHTPWSVQVTKPLAHLEQRASWWAVIAPPPPLNVSYCLVMGRSQTNPDSESRRCEVNKGKPVPDWEPNRRTGRSTSSG